jgi:hypothetical protein
MDGKTNKIKRGAKTSNKKNKKRRKQSSLILPDQRQYLGKRIPRLPAFGVYGAKTFPEKLITKVYYCDTGFQIIPTSGNGYFDYWIFRGNSPYDPDYSGVGTQPYYWDQFAVLYNNYRARASKITLTLFTTEPDTTLQNIKSTLFPWRANSPPSEIEFNDLKMLPKCKSLQWNQDRNDFYQLTMKNSCDTGFFSDNPYDKDTTATVSSNPTDQWYWIFTTDTLLLTTETTIYFDVVIEYDVLFYKRAQIAES